MKALIAIVAAAWFVCLGSTAASAAGLNYLSLDVGKSYSTGAGGNINDTIGHGTVAGLGIGRQITPSVRVDVTLARRAGYRDGMDDIVANGGTATGGAIKSTALMVNAYKNVLQAPRGVIYVGAGLGAARNSFAGLTYVDGGVTTTVDAGTKTGLAFQLTLGFDYPLFAWIIGAAYQYVDLDGIQTSDAGTVAGAASTGLRVHGGLRAHELHLTARYPF